MGLTDQHRQLAIAMNLIPQKPIPTLEESLTAFVNGMKKLGDKGLSGARADMTRRHLAGVVTMVNQEIAEIERNEKIEALNAQKADLAAKAKSLNVISNAPVANSLGSLS